MINRALHQLADNLLHGRGGPFRRHQPARQGGGSGGLRLPRVRAAVAATSTGGAKELGAGAAHDGSKAILDPSPRSRSSAFFAVVRSTRPLLLPAVRGPPSPG